jgi:hypothetical protein
MIQDIELNKDSQVGLCEKYLLKEMHEPIKSESMKITLYCNFLFQSCMSDELYSLDSDYFLSSLEDISAQI